jgi:hypothetical protein
MLEDERAIVVVEMLVEPQPRRSPSDQARQRGLPHRKRVAAEVVTVEFPYSWCRGHLFPA